MERKVEERVELLLQVPQSWLGYIPQGCSDADVSRSMNYWHGDYALSQAATELAKVSGSDSPPNVPNVSYSADATKLLASDFLEKGVLGHAVQQAGRILERVVHLSELPAAHGAWNIGQHFRRFRCNNLLRSVL